MLILTGIACVVVFVIELARQLRANLDYRRNWEARAPQADADFAHACGVEPDSTAAARIAAMRRALADATGISPHTIRADDEFGDPIWDSLDWLDVAFRIEKALDVKVMKNWIERAEADAGGRERLRVRHVVRAILPHLPGQD